MILDKHCGNLIKQIHDGMQKSANNDLRGRGLTVTQLNLLLSLYDSPDGELSLKQLEQIMHVAQSTTAGIVLRLEQKSLLESVPDPADKRIKLVRLTEAGKQCCIEMETQIDVAEAKLLRGLDENETRTLHDLLIRMAGNLQD